MPHTTPCRPIPDVPIGKIQADDAICTALDCTLPLEPDAPAPLCAHHVRQVFLWELGRIERHSAAVVGGA